MRNFSHWQIFFCGRGSKCDRGLYVLRFQAGEVGENFLGSVAGSQAGKHGAKSNPRPLENGLAAARFGVSNNSVFASIFGATLVSHGASHAVSMSIISRTLIELTVGTAATMPGHSVGEPGYGSDHAKPSEGAGGLTDLLVVEEDIPLGEEERPVTVFAAD
jgi:hypothetical protein